MAAVKNDQKVVDDRFQFNDLNKILRDMNVYDIAISDKI